jgi:ferredoxin-type protein NapG
LLAGAACTSCSSASAEEQSRLLLPPTARSEDFFSKCIRCFRCGEVCTAGCIEFHAPWASPKLAGTPYIHPRTAGCNTCTACTQVCPTGALTPITEDEVLEAVDMGLAYVDEDLCLSFLGRVCGVCHDACPFPGEAIVLESRAQPRVLEACVGCGRCEERCPQLPAAIRVFPEAPISVRWEVPS